MKIADSNQFFKNVEVKTAPRSGFNKSHKNVGTFTVGTITPILWDTLIPNSDATVKIDLTAQLPPLASDTYMRASVKLEAFAVPLRLLYGGFEKYFTGDKVYNAAGDPADVLLGTLAVQLVQPARRRLLPVKWGWTQYMPKFFRRIRPPLSAGKKRRATPLLWWATESTILRRCLRPTWA